MGTLLVEPQPLPAGELMNDVFRICPGRHFAEASLFIMIASVLHAFTIDYVMDEHGKPIIPEAKMTYGVIS